MGDKTSLYHVLLNSIINFSDEGFTILSVSCSMLSSECLCPCQQRVQGRVPVEAGLQLVQLLQGRQRLHPHALHIMALPRCSPAPFIARGLSSYRHLSQPSERLRLLYYITIEANLLYSSTLYCLTTIKISVINILDFLNLLKSEII